MTILKLLLLKHFRHYMHFGNTATNTQFEPPSFYC